MEESGQNKHRPLTSAHHFLVIVAGVVVALAVLSAVSLLRVVVCQHHIALALAADTLTAAWSSARQTVVRPGNTITFHTI